MKEDWQDTVGSAGNRWKWISVAWSAPLGLNELVMCRRKASVFILYRNDDQVCRHQEVQQIKKEPILTMPLHRTTDMRGNGRRGKAQSKT